MAISDNQIYVNQNKNRAENYVCFTCLRTIFMVKFTIISTLWEGEDTILASGRGGRFTDEL